MKVLFLGYTDCPLIDFLRQQGEEVVLWKDRISPTIIQEQQIEFIVSYGYRYIIKKDVLECLPNRVINLHISYLPWNKGADPNFWSFVDDTPKGVSVHRIDPGLDTGALLVQEKVDLSLESSFRETYGLLQNRIQQLFMDHWSGLKSGGIPPKEQMGVGSYHRSKDKLVLLEAIQDHWLDLPIPAVLDHIAAIRAAELNAP
ncbi:MAG: formyltransferase family protein [Bacteroidota bacterium]